jgi:hypothetical protein
VKHARADYDRIQDPWGQQDGGGYPVHSQNYFDRAIPENEPVFLIRGQDRIGWMVALVWAILHYVTAENRGEARKVCIVVVGHALRMLIWARKKDADIPDDIRVEAQTDIERRLLA